MRAIFLFGLLLICFCANAQTFNSSHRSLRYRFDNVQANFLIEDHRGLIYIGTQEGLVFYDGIQTETIFKTSSALNTAARRDSTIYFGTALGKLYKREWPSGAFMPIFQVPDSSEINDIFLHKNRIILATSGGGLWIIDGREQHKISESTGLSDNFVYDLEVLNNMLYVATDRGIDRIDLDTYQIIGSISTSVTTSLEAEQDMLWAGTYKIGLVGIEGDRIVSKKSVEVVVHKILSANQVLLFSTGEGIYYQKDGVQMQILASKSIADFLVNKEGLLMVLAGDGSLTKIDLRFGFISPSLPLAGEISAIASNDSLLFIADSAGISMESLIGGNGQRILKFDQRTVVTDLIASETAVYVATFDNGIFKYSLKDGRSQNFRMENGLTDNNVLSLTILNDTLWFVTLGGFSYLSPTEEIHNVSKPLELGSAYIYSVAAKNSEILIGTDGKGLYSYEKGSFTKQINGDLRGDETVYGIEIDDDGRIALSTKNSGILIKRHASHDWQKIALPETSGFMTLAGSLIGNIIVVSGTWTAFIGERHTIAFPETIGLTRIKNELLNNGTRSGNAVFLAADRGIAKIELSNQLPIPKVILHGFGINLSTSELRSDLDYDENHISYSFGPVWYTDPENVGFRYRLIGYEDTWNMAGSSGAVYPNLPPGDYTFELEAGYNGIYYPDTGFSHTFKINSPFYFKPWFIIVCLLFLFLLFYFILRLRINAVNRKRLSERQLIESELAILRNQVNPHFLFNSFNTLLNYIETQPQNAGEYLQRLSDYYRKILLDRHENTVSLKEEMENLEEYLYLQKMRFGEALEVLKEIDIKHYGSIIPSLSLQLLLENAIKHNIVSRSNPLLVEIRSKGDTIVVSNKINLKKNKEAGTGTGLKNIIGRYQALFGRTVKVNAGEDVFEIILPVIYKDHAHFNS